MKGDEIGDCCGRNHSRLREGKERVHVLKEQFLAIITDNGNWFSQLLEPLWPALIQIKCRLYSICIIKCKMYPEEQVSVNE